MAQYWSSKQSYIFSLASRGMSVLKLIVHMISRGIT
jgi:hypothetical protein